MDLEEKLFCNCVSYLKYLGLVWENTVIQLYCRTGSKNTYMIEIRASSAFHHLMMPDGGCSRMY